MPACSDRTPPPGVRRRSPSSPAARPRALRARARPPPFLRATRGRRRRSPRRRRASRLGADLDASFPVSSAAPGPYPLDAKGRSRRRHRRAPRPLSPESDDPLIAGRPPRRCRPGESAGETRTRVPLRVGSGTRAAHTLPLRLSVLSRGRAASVSCRPAGRSSADPGDDRCAPGGRGARGARSAHARARTPGTATPPGAAGSSLVEGVLRAAELSPTRRRSR